MCYSWHLLKISILVAGTNLYGTQSKIWFGYPLIFTNNIDYCQCLIVHTLWKKHSSFIVYAIIIDGWGILTDIINKKQTKQKQSSLLGSHKQVFLLVILWAGLGCCITLFHYWLFRLSFFTRQTMVPNSLLFQSLISSPCLQYCIFNVPWPSLTVPFMWTGISFCKAKMKTRSKHLFSNRKVTA